MSKQKQLKNAAQALARPNFIRECTTFFRRQTVDPLSMGAQALWHYLFYRLNEAYWAQPMFLTTNELAGALRISPGSATRYRDELAEKGYILYEHARKKHMGRYYVMSCDNPGEILRIKSPREQVEEDMIQTPVPSIDLGDEATTKKFIASVRAAENEEGSDASC